MEGVLSRAERSGERLASLLNVGSLIRKELVIKRRGGPTDVRRGIIYVCPCKVLYGNKGVFSYLLNVKFFGPSRCS